MENILGAVIRVIIMISIIYAGVPIVLLLLFIAGHADSILKVVCLLGCALIVIAVLVGSYFVANLLQDKQVSKVRKILLRPLCLLLASGVFYVLLAGFLGIY